MEKVEAEITEKDILMYAHVNSEAAIKMHLKDGEDEAAQESIKMLKAIRKLFNDKYGYEPEIHSRWVADALEGKYDAN